MSEAAPILRPMSRAAFDAFQAETGGRWERDEFLPIRSQADSGRHVLAKTAIARGLDDAVAQAGLTGTVWGDGMRAEIDDATDYEPDVSLTCNAADDLALTRLVDPILVVEVISPSNRTFTLGKYVGYFGLPSLVHCLMVFADRRRALHHRRGPSTALIETRILGPDGRLVFDPPGLALDLGHVWDRLTVPA